VPCLQRGTGSQSARKISRLDYYRTEAAVPDRIESQESNRLLYHIQNTCARNSDFSTGSGLLSRESMRHPSKIGSSNFRQAMNQRTLKKLLHVEHYKFTRKKKKQTCLAQSINHRVSKGKKRSFKLQHLTRMYSASR
jgi:hypothetical protein